MHFWLGCSLLIACALPIPVLEEGAWVAEGAEIANAARIAADATNVASKAIGPLVEGSVQMEVGEASGEGVYEFVVGSKRYVGQTGNIARRMAQHARKYGKSNISDFQFRRMPGSTKLDRLRVEQDAIDLGGLHTGKLWNKINAIRLRR